MNFFVVVFFRVHKNSEKIYQKKPKQHKQETQQKVQHNRF